MIGRKVKHFEIIDEIGKGAFSTVYKAFDNKLKREVALKLLIGEAENDDNSIRFEQESVVAAKVTHPNIVQVYECGDCKADRFISFELIEGVSLREWIRFARPSFEQICQTIIGVCLGVGAAHELGIVHRDLKPENIIVDVTGHPKVTDFGLASLPESRLTSKDISLGTVAYMSPEQAKGDSCLATTKSDVFSLGLILFESITGHLPFQAATHAEYLVLLANTQIAPIRAFNQKIPIDLAAIVDKCLVCEQRYRYTNASQLAQDLVAFNSGQQTLARPLTNSTKFVRFLRKNLVTVSFFLVISSLLIGLTTASIFFAWESNRNRKLQAVTAENAIMAVVNGIRSARPDSLADDLDQLRPIATEIRGLLNDEALGNNNRNAVNANIVLMLLFDNSVRNFEFLLKQSDRLTKEEFSTFLVAAKTIDKEVVESFVTDQLKTKNISKGRLAVLSLVAGNGGLAKQVAAIDNDQTDRETLIDSIAELQGSTGMLLDILEVEKDKSLISSMLLGMGEWQSLVCSQTVLRYSQDSDSGVAASAVFVMERHDLKESGTAQISIPDYTKKMIFVPVEDDAGNKYEVLATELTFGHLSKISNRPDIANIFESMKSKKAGRGGISEDLPITGLSADQIKTICNALSEEEGYRNAYAENVDSEDTNGFRLASLEEWRCAVSARAETQFFFGRDVSKLKNYGVVVGSFPGSAKILPPLRRRPNPIGLFDVYGNVAEVVENSEGRLVVVGGSSWATPKQCSSTTGFTKSITVGLRLARSLDATMR